MLAALLLAFFGFMAFSGSGGDMTTFGELMAQHVKGQIKTTIPDHDRRHAALTELSALNDRVDDMNKQLSKDVKALEKMIKNYESKPKEFDRLFTSMLLKREVQVNQLWNDRQAMLQHILPDEWQTIIDGAKAGMEKEATKQSKRKTRKDSSIQWGQ
jgi:hypothetical protein